MPTVLDRWTRRLAARRALLTAARARAAYWRARKKRLVRGTRAFSRAAAQLADRERLVKRRREQVAEAERVVARHRGIDPAAIRHVAPWLTASQSREVADALTPAFQRFGITTKVRAAAAVAQMAHESAGFRTTTEFASGDAYEGRRDLGNIRPGDGRRFRGRGLIQITGRANYAAVARAFGVDFVAHPELLATRRWSALASCWWWQTHGCNQLADRGDFEGLTRRINGGTNGLSERVAFHNRARQVAARLTP